MNRDSFTESLFPEPHDAIEQSINSPGRMPNGSFLWVEPESGRIYVRVQMKVHRGRYRTAYHRLKEDDDIASVVQSLRDKVSRESELENQQLSIQLDSKLDRNEKWQPRGCHLA